MEEILRYVLLHSAKRRELSVAIPLAAESTSLGQRLTTLRQGADSRERMLEAVSEFFDSNAFSADPASLPFNAEFGRFQRAIERQGTVTLRDLQRLFQQSFGRSAQALTGDPLFSRLRVRVTEGILALKLGSSMRRGLLAEYVRVLRLIDLAERIVDNDASLDEQTSRSLLRRTVRLPSSLFPLPRTTEKVSQSELEKERDRLANVSRLTATIRDTNLAIRELSALGGLAVAEPSAGDGLAPGLVARLTPRTREILASLNIDPAKTAAPAAISHLSAEARALSNEVTALEPPRRSTSLVRIGGTTLPSVGPGSLDIDDLGVEDGPKVPTSVGDVQPSGIGSLLIVMQQIKRYEAGELSHVENVLGREKRMRDTRRLRRTEETFITEVERKTEEERNFQSTARHEMKQEAEDTIKEDERFKIGATISVGYGKIFQSEVSTEFETSNSEENKDRSATSFAQEVIERAASKVSERIRTEHTLKTIEEFEEKNSHGFDNTAGPDHVIGIYQWLDRIYEVQVYDYGIRLFFDVMVPEPAAYLLQAIDETKAAAEKFSRPEKFGLKPSEIDENEDGAGTYYQELVARYQVSGVAPPPPETVAFSWSIALPSEGQPEPAAIETHVAKTVANITIPAGYVTESVGFSTSHQGISGTDAFLQLSFGGGGIASIHLMPPSEQDEFPPTEIVTPTEVGSFSGTLAVGIYAFGINHLVLTMQIHCTRLESHYQTWQTTVHDAVLAAYLGLEVAYQEQLAALTVQQGVSIEGRNPGENRMIERTELKRLGISTITGQDFDKFSAVLEGPWGEPRIDFDEAAAEGNYARFFEQAFEWENMTYELYPFYWGRRSTWDVRLLARDVDPLHAEFLKAGYARLRIPVRPDFELGVFHYLETGETWNGGELPEVVSDEYLALLEDLKERRDNVMTRTAIEPPWDIRLPTTLVRLKPTPTLPAWERDEEGNWLPVPEEPALPEEPVEPEEPEEPENP